MPSNRQRQREESMMNLEYHKGSFCVYTPIFCQEGYCSNCEIYVKKLLPTKTKDYQSAQSDTSEMQEAYVNGVHS
jgi:hypothetical protein